jgi:hypothetical protein
LPSETGNSHGDVDEQYLTASYGVYLTKTQARNVFAYVKQKQASSPVWQAGTVNCTGFISDVANFMGLRTPAHPTLMYPENLLDTLRPAALSEARNAPASRIARPPRLSC